VLAAPLPSGITPQLQKRKGKTLVKVLDAVSGALRQTIGPFKGKVTVQLRDVNSDGVADLILSERRGKKTRKKVFSGTDLAPLPASLA
jgi:hypothetical protein